MPTEAQSTTSSPWHAGEIALQEKVGVAKRMDEVGRRVLRDHLIDQHRQFYPQLPFIVAHLGSFADDWRAHQAVIDALGRHPNVWADTSGVRRFDYLVQAARAVGGHRLIFGSDGSMSR